MKPIEIVGYSGERAVISPQGLLLCELCFKPGDNLVATYHDPNQYETNPYYLNTVIGPNAGRIRSGSFPIEYQLDRNEGLNNLHSGSAGLSHVIWSVSQQDEHRVVFKYLHKDGTGGFVGNIAFKAVYEFEENVGLRIVYSAVSDRDCHVNMANHNYYNINSATTFQLMSDSFVKLDQHHIPSMEVNLMPAYNFNQERSLTQFFDSGYELDNPFGLVRGEVSAILRDKDKTIKFFTNQDYAVVYTANEEFLHHQAICLEFQNMPSRFNLVKKGQEYKNRMVISCAYHS